MSLIENPASPLFEGPDQGPALIEPSQRFPHKKLPSLAIMCFFPRVLASLATLPGVQMLTKLTSPMGPDPIYIIEQQHKRIAVCAAGFGAPLAAIALEELIALGCQDFIVCGGAGSLTDSGKLGQIVLVSEALRDEGVSHHYLAPSRSVKTAASILASAQASLEALNIPYRSGPSWTTDALYRETPARIKRRKEQGCLTVEMEAAALLAVAQYRKARLIPLLCCGDDLSGEAWDFRQWTSAQGMQEKLFWLSLELAIKLTGS